MSRLWHTVPGCLVFVLALLPAAKSATINSSVPRSLFEAALAEGKLSGQNFDTIESGTILHTVDGVTYSVSGDEPAVVVDYTTTTPPNSLGTVSGFIDSTEFATIAFSKPITAFAIDIDTFTSEPRVYAAMVDKGTIVYNTPGSVPGTGNIEFIGFTSDAPFTAVNISAVKQAGGASPFSYTLDSLVYGNASNLGPIATIPEPSPWTLVAGALALLAVLKCRVSQRRGRLSLDWPYRDHS